jgi:RHS repeat-associated protein
MNGSDPTPYQGPNPTYNYNFYGITGQKLAMLTCNGSNYPAYPTCAITGQNVYFGKKLIVSGGVNVVTDRLGSVRANGQGDSFAYYPYGEERTSTANGLDKFATYFRDAAGQDYADQRYYNAGMGRFFSPDPGGIGTANPLISGSWNRYSYSHGDPVNRYDPSGLEAVDPDCPPDDPCPVDDGSPCDDDPTMIGCPGGGGGGGGGYSPVQSGGSGGGGSSSSNPCSFGNLSAAAQAMLGNVSWGSESAAAQQMFVTISADAAALGLNLAADGFIVSSIQVAGQGGQSETELNLSGGNVADLVGQMGSNFTSQAQDPLVGSPHSGYTGNYRQNSLTWSMQINTNIVAGTVQIDIDPYNPSFGCVWSKDRGELQPATVEVDRVHEVLSICGAGNPLPRPDSVSQLPLCDAVKRRNVQRNRRDICFRMELFAPPAQITVEGMVLIAQNSGG